MADFVIGTIKPSSYTPPDKSADPEKARAGVGAAAGPSLSVGSRQWIRSCKVEIGGVAINCDNLQVTIMVRQADQQHNNHAYVRITNLSQATAQKAMNAAKEFAKFKLEAGYQGRSGIIFEGEISQARKGKEPNGTDTYLDVLAMSGYQAYGYSTISKTLSAGATVDDVISTIADSMKKHNLSIGHLAKLGGEKFSRAVVLHGMSRDQMRKYTQGAGASWSVQNQKIFVVKNGKPVPGMERELNASSGLIGIPEQTMQGIVAKILIDPGFAVHQHVRIDPKININEALAPISPLAQFGKTSNIPFRTEIPKVSETGDYTVVRVDHDGVMEAGPWYTTLTMVSQSDQSKGAIDARAAAVDANPPGAQRGVQDFGNTEKAAGLEGQSPGGASVGSKGGGYT